MDWIEYKTQAILLKRFWTLMSIGILQEASNLLKSARQIARNLTDAAEGFFTGKRVKSSF